MSQQTVVIVRCPSHQRDFATIDGCPLCREEIARREGAMECRSVLLGCATRLREGNAFTFEMLENAIKEFSR
jgi:hypothetical protein